MAFSTVSSLSLLLLPLQFESQDFPFYYSMGSGITSRKVTSDAISYYLGLVYNYLKSTVNHNPEVNPKRIKRTCG